MMHLHYAIFFINPNDASLMSLTISSMNLLDESPTVIREEQSKGIEIGYFPINYLRREILDESPFDSSQSIVRN